MCYRTDTMDAKFVAIVEPVNWRLLKLCRSLRSAKALLKKSPPETLMMPSGRYYQVLSARRRAAGVR